MHATIEPGLPGTGPLPVHLHTGHPTPWSEGTVVRFEPDDGASWIGNLQSGDCGATKVEPWPAADAMVVIAKGAAYFVRPRDPENWRFVGSVGIDCRLTPDQRLAILTTYSDLIALAQDGSENWSRRVAIDGVEILEMDNGLILGAAAIDPLDEWYPFAVSLHDGLDANGMHARNAMERAFVQWMRNMKPS